MYSTRLSSEQHLGYWGVAFHRGGRVADGMDGIAKGVMSWDELLYTTWLFHDIIISSISGPFLQVSLTLDPQNSNL